MNRRQKIIATTLWGVLLTVTLVLVAAWSGQRLLPAIARATGHGEADERPLFPVPAFTLTDQEGRSVTLDTLRGSPWIAAFVFTRCPGPCPVITQRMANLQGKLPPVVKFISFSLDPKFDTPPVLKAYSERYKADGSRWHFLTGDRDKIDGIAKDLKIAAQRGPDPIDINHGTHLVLINPDGKVHGYYLHGDDEATQRLIADATRLAD